MARTLLYAACIALTLLLPWGRAAAERNTELIVPEMPTADMRMSWQDFRELLMLIQTEQRPEDTAKPQPPPPVPWSLYEAHYLVDATSEGSAVVRATLRYRVWREGWVQLPLFGNGVGMESVSVNGATAPLVPEEDHYAALVEEPGEYTVETAFSVRTSESDGSVSLDFDAPEAGRAHMQLVIGAPQAVVTAEDATRIDVKRGENGLTAELVFRRTSTIGVSWRLPAKEKLPEPPPTPAEAPRFSIVSTTLATATESHLACDVSVQVDLLRGKVNGFMLHLPPSAQVLDVTGTGATWKADTQGDAQSIDVRLNFDADQHYALNLRYETPVPEGAATVAVPVVHVDGAARERGYIAVTTQGNVEADQAAETEGLRRIDTADLPTELRGRASQPILHAFQFTGDTPLLALAYKRLQDVPVRVAGIDRGRVVSVITREGLVITQAQYLVRNNLKKFMRLSIGADAEVWGARVNGKPVRPARDGGEDATGSVLVPLVKSQEAGKDLGAFPVEIIYMRRIDPLDTGRNRRTLSAPEADILANFVDWVVLVPEGDPVLSAWGGLDRVDGLRPLTGFAPGRRGAGTYTVDGNTLRIPGDGQRETIYRLREGIERFFISDINNAATASNIQGGAGRYDGAQRDHLPDVPSAPSVAHTTAGVLPVDFTMPEVGVPIFFERVVVPMNTPMQVTVEMIHLPLLKHLQPTLYMLAFLVGLCAMHTGAALARRRRVWPWAVLGVFLLIPLAAGVWWFHLAPAVIYRWGSLGVLSSLGLLVIAAARRRRGGDEHHA